MKKFFSKIVSFLQTLFTNLDAWIHEHVQPSIELVQRFKEFIDSPAVDILTALIPGTADDKAAAWIRANLPKAINTLSITDAINKEKSFEKKLLLLAEYLKTLSPEMRNGVYLRLSSLIAKTSGGKDKVKGHSVDLLTQMQYSKLVEGLEHSDLQESKYTATVPAKQLIWNANLMKYE